MPIRAGHEHTLTSVTEWSHPVDLPISPAAQAANARLKADGLAGKERDYWLWLASEWDKAAARHAPSVAHALRPRGDGAAALTH